MRSILRSAVWILVFFCSIVLAEREPEPDVKVSNILQEVDQLFRQRSISNPHLPDIILEKLVSVENQAEDSDLNYDVYIFESKVLYWKAKYILHALEKMSNEGKSCLELAKAKADAAVGINGYAEGYYHSALSLGGLVRYIVYSAPLNSLGNPNTDALNKAWKAVEDASKGMENAIESVTRVNQDGETLDGWGPYRERALIQASKPYMGWNWAFGAKEDLKKAYENARNYANNVVGYAKSLLFLGNKYDRLMASLILDLMLSKDPKIYNKDRVEETLIEFEEAKKLRGELPDGISYQTAKEGLQDYATATKLHQIVSIRIANCQTKLNDLNGERLSWLETQKRQEKIFSTFDLLRSKIEDAAPALILKIQAYLASQQDTLQTVLEDLNRQLKETQDPKMRDALQFDIIVLSDLAAVKQSLGDSQEDLKKAIDTAIHGNDSERAKALSYFDPLTQICLKWVFQVTPPTRDNIFSALRQEIIDLEAFSKEHLSTLESEIQIATQNLSSAQDDEFIAQTMVTKIYQACQNASNLM